MNDQARSSTTDDITPDAARPAVRMWRGRVVAGRRSARYDPADHTTVLSAYVRLIRRLRSLRAEDELDLRRTELQLVTEYWARCLMDQVQREAMVAATPTA